jgi:hypothetical protein
VSREQVTRVRCQYQMSEGELMVECQHKVRRVAEYPLPALKIALSIHEPKYRERARVTPVITYREQSVLRFDTFNLLVICARDVRDL